MFHSYKYNIFKMKTKIFYLVVLAILFSINIKAYTYDKDDIKSNNVVFLNDYEKDWNKADSLIDLGLPKSALEIVNMIYDKAKNEKNAPNYIRAIMYKLKLQTETREDDFVNAIRDLKNEVEVSSFPIKPVLQSMLAEMYWSYYQTNRYRFFQRSKTENFKQDDIRTWDIYKIIDEVILNYKTSLDNSQGLQNIDISDFNEILNEYYKDKTIPEGRILRPTLFDFLAHRAIDFFTSTEPEITRPAEQFLLNNDSYFSNSEDFANLNITTKDTYSYKYYAVTLLQSAIKFHLKDESPDALIDIDLKRLAFVKQNSGNENKDNLYLNALEHLENKYSNDSALTSILYSKAYLIYSRSAKYNPLISDNNKWDAKTAYDICEKGIQKFPDSKGAINCKSLQSTIKTKSLDIRTEDVIVPSRPFKTFIKYKNVNLLYFKIVKTNEEDLKSFYGKLDKNEYYNLNEKLIEHYKDYSPVSQFTTYLPDDGDYQTHSTEAKIPELPIGLYIILVGTDNNFTFQNEAVSFTLLPVSNISYMDRTLKNGNLEFYLLNRETGEPLAGAKATMFVEKYNYNNSTYDYLEGKSYTADKDGYFQIPTVKEYRRFYLNIEYNNDRLNTSLSGNAISYGYSNYNTYMFYQGENNNEKYDREKYQWVVFFTDRAIYRPGQTIYFKGIVLETYKGKTEIKSNYSNTINLLNPNYQKSNELPVTSNEYGTFNGSFTAPSTGLNGRYTLQTADGKGYAYVQVEDYKRPKFEVNFDPVKGSFKLGEKVITTGKAKSYSGANVDNAEVKYRVVRKAIFPEWWYYWRSYPQSAETEIINGVSSTNDTGAFEITFTAIPDLSVSKESELYFTFTIYADVTDINGETRSGLDHISIGYTALKINMEIPNTIDKNGKDEFKFSTTNLDGQNEPAEGTITIYKLKNPANTYRKRLWEEPDKYLYSENEYHNFFPNDEYKDENNIQKWEKELKVSENNFNTKIDSTLKLQGLSGWNQGMYVIEAKSKDKFGEDVKGSVYFAVFSTGETTLPYPNVNWFNPIKTIVEPGDDASFIAGSSESNVKILYEIEQNGKIFEKKWINLNKEQKYFSIPIKEEYRGNIAVHLSYIRNNRFYTNDEIITIPYTNKMLDITFETFRNKLQPGENEEWRIRIAGKNGDKVTAEMVATLYDASLDAYAKNNWNFNIYELYNSTLRWYSDGDFGINNFTLYSLYWNTYTSGTYYQFDRLNWFGVQYINYYGSYYGYEQSPVSLDNSAPVYQKVTTSKGEINLDGKGKLEDERTTTEKTKESPKKKDKGIDKPKDESLILKKDEEKPPISPLENIEGVTARKDFNETAFFYPDLETDANGEIIIKFKIPEALTKWNMLGFAHTKDFKYGLVKNELITQKELMIVPNAPRFFREGDNIVFSAKVTNLSEKDLSGNAQLELFDAFTMIQIDNLLKNNEPVKPFETKKGLSSSLNWELSIPEGIEAVLYRIVAKADNFSDGEEMVLPVLSNRMLVTETMPLPIRSNETKHFTMDKLVNNKSTTLSNYKLSLEFTSNPAWYAIQALPYLMEYPYECAEQVFSRYYANSIATFIANSNPKIKQVFDTWKNYQPDALLSNLEKNQELKTLMLEETPWVQEAKDESARKRRVGILFEINRMTNELEKAFNKLSKMQVSSGAWPWFEGMPEDRYITQHIITGIGQLDHIGMIKLSTNDNARSMVQKALYYMDNQMKNDYENLLKLEKAGKIKLSDNHLWSTEIQYLYARSFFKEFPLSENCNEGYEYFIGQGKKYWNDYDKYFQGMLALSLQRYGDITTPQNIVNSLKERAIVNEEMGMYWKENTWGYYWYQAPIETQSLLIEVFSEVAKDQKAVDDMKVWLLKNKQTQDWKTTKATVEACYALLLEGTDWLANTDMIDITLGTLKIEPSKMENVKVEAGTGYFKTSWSGSDILPEMGNVTVTKKDEGVSWGALYWQYFEQLDKITFAETPLKLKKKLFLQTNTSSGPVITPIDENTRLNIGDLVKVRIELEVDRDMEYVQMKDMRAACFEPLNVISQYKYQDGLGYYESTRDASTNFFFGWLPKGSYVFEYPLRITNTGDFSNGITSIQCMYAPEFTSHSEGIRVNIK
jgi:hypothetical protein